LEGSNCDCNVVECVWNQMAHDDAWEGKWRGNWRMEWVASTLTLPQNVVYPALLTLMHTPRLSAVDWTDAPVDLNGLIRFSERRNLVCACHHISNALYYPSNCLKGLRKTTKLNDLAKIWSRYFLKKCQEHYCYASSFGKLTGTGKTPTRILKRIRDTKY